MNKVALPFRNEMRRRAGRHNKAMGTTALASETENLVSRVSIDMTGVREKYRTLEAVTAVSERVKTIVDGQLGTDKEKDYQPGVERTFTLGESKVKIEQYGTYGLIRKVSITTEPGHDMVLCSGFDNDQGSWQSVESYTDGRLDYKLEHGRGDMYENGYVSLTGGDSADEMVALVSASLDETLPLLTQVTALGK